MLFTNFKAGEKEYRCRLNTRALIGLEKEMGCNPLTIFMKVGNNGDLPSLSDMLTILHASLQCYEHGISKDDVYDIYDAYIEDGNTYIDFINVIMEIYKTSGLFKEEKKAGKSAKNA